MDDEPKQNDMEFVERTKDDRGGNGSDENWGSVKADVTEIGDKTGYTTGQ